MTYLQFLRMYSGRKAKDIAKACQISLPRYSMYERGERRPPHKIQIKLAQLFSQPRKDIFPYFPYK